jgi:uncharacterized protein YkwD
MAAMPRLRHAALALLLLAGTAGAQQRVFEPVRPGPPPARGTAPLRQAMIAGHDRARDAVGLPRLTWDERLADAARSYARELARTGRFRHAVQPQGPQRQGENLFTGTRGDYAYAEVIGLWNAEGRDFVNRPVPDYSRTGRWQDVSHYAQLVARATTHFGCAAASNARDDFVVCRYWPAGNVVGTWVY